ncbi:MAG: SIP domain-containing protein [Actinomycetota bacterium]
MTAASPGTDSLTVTGFVPGTKSDIENVVEHVIGNHHDTILFIVTHGPQPVAEATSVGIVAVDPTGLNIVVGEPERHDVRFDFEPPIETITDLQGRLLGLLAEAREAAPEHPETSIEREMAASASLKTVVARVAAVEQLTPNLIEITVDDLDGFPILGSDEFHYLMVPGPGGDDLFDDGFEMSQLESLPAEQQPASAYYTARRRTETSVDYWVVLHSVEAGVSGWATRARPGDRLAVWGPRNSHDLLDEVDHQLLVVDETGLAAAAAIVDESPSDLRTTVVIEVVDERSRPPFPQGPNVEVVWCERGDAEPGTSGLLLAAVQGLTLEVGGLQAFGAAESREISAVRRYLRNDLGATADRVHMTGYWRR